MPHAMPLMATLVAALSVALLLGVLARKLNLPPIVGYLLAGIVIGPHTPGFAGDMELAAELAEIGIILLMFGVGLHFSPRELADARGVALPGALVQMLVATGLGWGLARWFGWGDGAGLLFGLSLSVASTVVLLRALQERGEDRTPVGHIAVGWLVVEDLAMVLALVLAPMAARLLEGGSTGAGVWDSVAETLAKLVAFVALMLVVGARVLPWCLSLVAGLRSRELFSLAALVAAVGVAFAAYALFGVSLALGAFLSGMVLGQSALSQKAAEQTLPLRDAFAVLFFVSVGMLFEPAILWQRPVEVAAALAVVVLGKALAAWGIARLLGQTNRAALTIAAALGQIGEFSFILAGLGVAEGLLPPEGRDLVLAAALLSIGLNPLLFWLVDRMAPAPVQAAAPVPAPAPGVSGT